MKRKLLKNGQLIFLLSAKNNLFNEQLKVIKEIYSVGSNKDVDFVILFDAIEGDKFQKNFLLLPFIMLIRMEIFYPM